MYTKNEIEKYIILYYNKFKKKPLLKHSPFNYIYIKKYFNSWDDAFINTIQL